MFLVYRTFEEFRAHPTSVTLLPEEVQHLRARRMESGETILLCDGFGRTAPAVLQIASIGKKEAWHCLPDFGRTDYVDSPVRILYSALPKGSRLDFIVEKGTELGMTRLIPVEFEHSVREHYARPRAERLAVQAAGQSQRRHLPVCDDPLSFEQLLDRVESSAEECTFFLLDPSGHSAADLIAPEKPRKEASFRSRAIIVGPEGGLTQPERVALTEKGALLVSLSDGILRIETAAIIGLGFLNLLGK